MDDVGGSSSSSSALHLRRTRSSRTRTPRGAGAGGSCTASASTTPLLLVGPSHSNRWQSSHAFSSQTSSSLPKWARIVERKPETTRNDGWMWEKTSKTSSTSATSASESRATTPRSSRRHSRAQQEEPDPRRRPREDHHGDDRNRRCGDLSSSSSPVLHEVLVEEDSILRTFWYQQLSRELDVRVRQLVGQQVLEDVVHSPAAHSFFFGCQGLLTKGSASTTATAAGARTATTTNGGLVAEDGAGNEGDPDDFVTYFSLVEEAAIGGDGGTTRTTSEAMAVAVAASGPSPRKRPKHIHHDSHEITDLSARADAVRTSPLHLLLQRQLPILVVTPGPYDMLDRQTLWVPQLVQQVRVSCPRTCCVWIDLGACDHDNMNPYGADLANRHGGNSGNINNGYWEGSTTTGSNHHPWKKELLRQCVLQEPRQRRSAMNSPSLDGHGWTERMVDWARHCTRFDDICVVLEASGAERNNGTIGGGSAQSMRLEALRWMGHLRDHYGVPFKVVIMGPAMGITDFSLQASTGPGAAGWCVTTVHLRSPYSNRPPKERASSIQPIITPASSPLCCHLLHVHQPTPQQLSHSNTSASLSRIQSLLQLPSLHRNQNLRDGVDHIRVVHSSSMARSVMECKKQLAQSLLPPASFFVPMLMWALTLVDDTSNNKREDKSSTLDAYRPHLPREVLLRLQWFLLHPGARSYVTSTMEEACRSKSSSQLLRHLGLRVGKLNVMTEMLSLLSPPSTGSSKSLVSVPVDGGMAIRLAALERLLGLRSGLAATAQVLPTPTLSGLRNPTWRRIFCRDNDPKSSSRCLADLCCSLELRHVLNQLIVAIGEFPVEMAVTDDETREMLMAVADKLLFPNGNAPSQLTLDSTSAFGTTAASPWTFDPQPRRDLVAGLVREAEMTSDVDTTFAAGTLYSLILHLVSIPEADWFALWRKWHLDRRERQSPSRPTAIGKEEDEVNEPAPAQELYDWFRCGVAQLEYLGLVRERRSSLVRGKAVYDKPVLVWCGGD